MRFAPRAGKSGDMMEDPELLRRFAEERAQDALAEVVRRRINLVYSAALRQTGGDSGLAEDVTQTVFIALAQNAPHLARRATITSWLYTTTRFAAAKAVRARRRREQRELEAQAMNEIHPPNEAAANWQELRPVLDDAMHDLGERDRELILLRFFEGRAFKEIGATCGLQENSARMRVERALEKLRTRLAKRGITSTAAALGGALSAQAVTAAPTGLAATVSGALAGAVSAGGTTLFALTFMSTSKIIVGVGVVALVFVAGLYSGRSGVMSAPSAHVASVEAAQTTAALATLKAENAKLKNSLDQAEAARLAADSTATAAKSQLADTEAKLQDANGKLEAVRVQQVKRAITNSLRQVHAARDQFLLEHGHWPTVDELVGEGKYIRQLKPVSGEDYTHLDLANDKGLSVTTSDGIKVDVDLSYAIPGAEGVFTKPPPMPKPALVNAINASIDAYRGAHAGQRPPMSDPSQLLPYFQDAKAGADYLEWLEARKAASSH